MQVNKLKPSGLTTRKYSNIPCGVIQMLADQIIPTLGQNRNVYLPYKYIIALSYGTKMGDRTINTHGGLLTCP